MSNKHTPAPWIAVNEGKHWNNPQIDSWNVYYGNDKEHVVDKVIECAYTEANAHLIAAAPDLLDALIELSNWYKSEIGLPAAKANSAISKATGGNQ